MTHIHTLRLDVPKSTRVYCEGCKVALRLATGDEARFIDMTNGYGGDVLLGPFNTTVVPLDFSLFQEV